MNNFTFMEEEADSSLKNAKSDTIPTLAAKDFSFPGEGATCEFSFQLGKFDHCPKIRGL